jgi:hypothetical protein
MIHWKLSLTRAFKKRPILKTGNFKSRHHLHVFWLHGHSKKVHCTGEEDAPPAPFWFQKLGIKKELESEKKVWSLWIA